MGQTVRGVVAAGHPQTAEAGAEMLRRGGNAFDAVVAAALTACVTESVLTSLAGGGFLLAHTATGEDRLFDFFSQTPGRKEIDFSLDFYPIEANFGDVIQEFHIGLGSMAVPGTLAGLLHGHRRLGRLPLAAVIEPAVHWARAGIEVTPFQAYCFQVLQPILTATPATRAMYAPQGPLLQAGDMLRFSQFADTLAYLAKNQGQALYQGELAEQIARDCATQGGYLTRADLSRYRVIERSPLRVTYRGNTLLSNPPPSSGGTLIAFSLKLLAQAEMAATDYTGPGHLALLTAAMGLTNAARRDGYDANLYQRDITDWFLGEAHLASYYQAFGDVVNKWGSTTHISVLDAEGNAASLTGSNGEGAAYVIPGTDIMINNMLGEEDLNPHGFHQWHPNRRISSMMAPSMVLQEGQPRLVLGSGGSNRIRTAILQVMSNVLDFDMDLETAVTAPRVHWERGVFHLEPGIDRAVLEATSLLRDVQPVWWQRPNMFFGGVHTVARLDDGTIIGMGDPRRGGAVAYS
ncbi:hypothetical protein XM38_035380 [Halomicronema hongdechloris C2206]|uniref:Glutathione hydrolase proenzyme n=1 Tax=Halomicronema hongdechloris C2206 TaxID=1641165 RepID=A0A1Z3HQJ3_9CYAN|nr:gamma-glutamyltransferase [Halomicronema hongdechloris]ASC72580.1 hypothetical protein XM38_035380 [Halomicronema hongdechloris C2206]